MSATLRTAVVGAVAIIALLVSFLFTGGVAHADTHYNNHTGNHGNVHHDYLWGGDWDDYYPYSGYYDYGYYHHHHHHHHHWNY